MTCRKTFILATDALTREAAYVALSRGRESNRVYALEPAVPERAEYVPAAGREKDARAALVDALGRSRAQTMASDVARPARLASQLGDARRERHELRQARNDARDVLRTLEGDRPIWLRPGARARHAAATGRAKATVERIDRALLGLDAREATLLEQHAAERAAREPERPHERVIRAHEHGRGMELGL